MATQNSTPITSSSPTFAERLRAAKELQEKSERSRRRWFRGPRANFAPDVAVEPADRPRQRDEFIGSLRDVS